MDPSQNDATSTPPQTTPTEPIISPPFENIVPVQKTNKKKKLIIIGVTVVLALIAAGVAFALYLPNSPENVWNASLDRTGQALQKVTLASTEKSKLEALKKSQITGDIKYTGADSSYGGTFSTTFDETKLDSNTNFVVKSPDQPDKEFGAAILSERKQDNLYPTIYFQLKGLSVIGGGALEAFYPGITEYDGKWISVEEGYLRSLAKSVAEKQAEAPQPSQPQPPKKEEKVTADDIAELARTASQTVSEYVLTANPQKAIFERRNFIGDETIDNVKMYRYKVGINKAHAKDMCKVMTDRLWATKIHVKMRSNSEADEQKANEQKAADSKECQESIDKDIKETDTFEMWIDTQHKLVHKARIFERETPQSYTDIGQTYKGDKEVALFITHHEHAEMLDTSLKVSTNLDTNITKATLNLTNKTAGMNSDLSAVFEAKPFSGEIKVEKPTGAIPIKDIFDRYKVKPDRLIGVPAVDPADEPVV